MVKYRAKGGGFSGFGIAIIIFLIAGGLIGLTVWLVMKNTPPATCDVSVSSVNVAATADKTGNYPITINYSGNGSNACANAQATFNAELTPTTGPSTTPSISEPVSQGVAVISTNTDPKTKVKLTYFIVNPDSSQGPTHTYP